jgi:hypothetical protein
MQNGISRFRVGAIADPRVICIWEGLICFFGKPGLIARLIVLNTATVCCIFTIPASWQPSARRAVSVYRFDQYFALESLRTPLRAFAERPEIVAL